MIPAVSSTIFALRSQGPATLRQPDARLIEVRTASWRDALRRVRARVFEDDTALIVGPLAPGIASGLDKPEGIQQTGRQLKGDEVVRVRPEVIPFILVALGAGVVVALACALFRVPWPKAAWPGAVVAIVFSGYFLYFFRDPERRPPADPDAVVAGADGVILRISDVREDRHLKADCVRISIFLSLFDVHVNRAPIGGRSRFLGYVPGKHFFTFQEKSSEFNQHNAILIEGDRTRCLVYQIVGPVARRVVYWPDHDKAVPLKAGDRIGMMKFGSRLDMYFPKADIAVTAKEGDTVTAGETVVARIGQGGRG